MYVRLSKLRRVVAEQAKYLFNQLQEDSDRLRRGVQDNWGGESHDNFEEALELEDFEFEAKKKEEEPEEDDSVDDSEKSDDKPAFLKSKEEPKKAKKSPPKEEEPEEADDSPEDSGEEEEEPKKEPSPKHKKAKKGLEKAQKQKALPKSQIDQKTGRKQDVDLDALAQLATEAGYRLEKVQPEEPDPDDDFGLSDLGDSDGGEDCGLGIDPSFDDGKFPGDDDEMNFDGPDTEKEDVALFSSDEDLADVLGQGHEEEEEETGLEGHPLSMKKSLPVAKQGLPKSGALKLHIRK